jgi:type I restriction enzyme M protein
MSSPENPKEISLSKLESHLAEAANILRGPIDQADFKAYIFPLLFFKRISDVYDEEFEEALQESGGDADYAAFAENHRFQIPKGAHWDDVRKKSANIGQAIQKAIRAIEKANPETLHGIFGDTKWSNKDRLSDDVLKDLVEHFSTESLSNQHVPPDVLGQAYEYLIKRFADDSNKKAGEFYTPRSAVQLMVDILDPEEGETIYDPACGTGGMLIGVVQHVKDSDGNARRLWGKLYGQEKNLTTSAIARMNLFLHGIEDFHVAREDTLRNPAFFDKDKLLRFDCVIANPPFSLEKWGADNWEKDPYGRNTHGVPPQNNGDWAWAQHMLASMKEKGGRMAVVLPQGVLFRSGQEAKIRQKILESDLLEAVIVLGPNLFYGTNLAASILIFRADKEEKKKKKVLLIDGSELFQKGRNQNTLEEKHREELYKLYQDYRKKKGRAAVVSLDEIKKNDWNLNVSRYIEIDEQGEARSLEEIRKDLSEAVQAVDKSEKELVKILSEEGLL